MRVSLAEVASFLLPRLPLGGALAPSERRTLVKAAEVLMKGGPHGLSAEDIATNVERFLVVGRSRRAWRVRVLLQLVEVSPLPRLRRPFSRLTLEERRAWIVQEWIAGRPIGRICAKVKNLVVLGAYSDPKAAARTGYVPVHRRKRFLMENVFLRESA